MITVEVIDKDFDIEVGAKNIVTTCDPATVTATNSLSTVLGTVSAPSDGTGNIPISDSTVNKSDGTLIANVPAETNYNVADSVITVEYADGTPISTTNVKATDAALIEVPNPPTCPTLDDLVDSSTVADVVDAIELAGKECSVRTGLLDKYTNSRFAGGSFGTLSSSALSVFVNGNTIYVLNGAQIDLYNATTFAFEGSVLGFTRAAEIDFSPTTYAVVDFGANEVSIRNISDNIETASFPVVSGAFSICFNDTFTLLYVASFNAAGSLEIYNLAGVSQGSVSGFDARIIEVRRVNTEYWVLTSTGAGGANTQRVRKMRFSDNTQVSSHSIGLVATIGAIRAMVILPDAVYVATSLGSQNVYTLICYELDFTSPQPFVIALVGVNAYGLTYNPNSCDDLIMALPEAGLCYNIIK